MSKPGTSKTSSKSEALPRILCSAGQTMIGPIIAQLNGMVAGDRLQVLRAIAGSFGYVVQPAVSALSVPARRAESPRPQTSKASGGSGNQKGSAASSTKKSSMRSRETNAILDQDEQYQEQLAVRRELSHQIRLESQRTGGSLANDHDLVTRRSAIDALIDARRNSLLASKLPPKEESSETQN